MKVIKAVDREVVDNSHFPIFEGGQVLMNPLIGEEDTRSYRMNVELCVWRADEVPYAYMRSGVVRNARRRDGGDA